MSTTKPITKQNHADMLAVLRAFEGRRMHVRYVPEGETEARTHEGVLTDIRPHERLGHPLFRIGGTLLAALNDRLVRIEPAETIHARSLPDESGSVCGATGPAAPGEEANCDACFDVLRRDLIRAVPVVVSKNGPRLTRTQSAQVKSLVEDSGYSKKEARVLVLTGGFSR